MKRVSHVQVLGDSILKGIQVDSATGRYVTRNDIGIPGLERDFGLTVKNGSHFGATVVKGGRLLDRLLEKETPCDVVVMDFGGNDCDFRWDQVAADPEGEHRPNVPLEEFLQRYREMIAQLRLHGITPVLTTLPPLEPERFFHWWCRDLDQAEEVCVYAKLPRGFHIPTPVGNYSPDWAIAFHAGTVKHIFFVAETKGTMESLELRPIERAKISCARKLFNEMSTSKVKYHDVDSYKSLLDVMNSL